MMLSNELLCSGNSLLHRQTVEREAVKALLAFSRRIGNDALLCVEALLTDIGSLDKRDYRQVEVLGESIVTAVVCRYSHDGSRAISGEHILRNPNRNTVACERVDGIRAREHARYMMVGHTFKLSTALHIGKVFVDIGLLVVCSQFLYELALRCQHHERNSEHRIGTCCEDSEVLVAVLDGELHLRSFRPSYPVALRLLDGIAPLDSVQSVEKPLCVCRHTKAPLLHLPLHDRVSATYADTIDHLVVGKHGAKTSTPVHHCLAKISNTVVHKGLLLLHIRHGLPLIGGE